MVTIVKLFKAFILLKSVKSDLLLLDSVEMNGYCVLNE